MTKNPQKKALESPGDDLSSRSVSGQVLSTLARFTSLFGMGRSGSRPLKSPRDSRALRHYVPQSKLFVYTERSECALLKVNRRRCFTTKNLHRPISTTKLKSLPILHLWPIKPVVYGWSITNFNLGVGLALRCFQRLSLPNVATQRCS